MITLEHLFFSYPERPPVLEDISLNFPEGSISLLAGRNGSGKTTLLYLISGLLSPSKGALTIAGASRRESSKPVGLVFQDPDVQILGTTLGEDLMLGLPENQKNTAHSLAERFALQPLWDAPVHTLSGGEKRKLCLASTLAGSPPVLLMDEPLSGLDYPAIKEMRSIIEDNQKAGLTQIIACHDLEPLIDLAHTLSVLSRGKLVLNGAPADILDEVDQFGIRPPCSWRLGREIRTWR